jgi:alpha-tubulin suppressor-like RCC1 family protein
MREPTNKSAMHRLLGFAKRARGRTAIAVTIVLNVFAFAATPSTAQAATPPAVSAGRVTSTVLKSDGTVWTFGRFAIGLKADRGIRQETELSNVTMIDSGVLHTLALKSDGTVWAYGENDRGQLGRTPSALNSPVGQVAGLSDVVAVSAGGHSVVLKADGTVLTFGPNASGQLGRANSKSPENDWLPRPVAGLSGVVAIAAGAVFTVALKSDGTVWTFGFNGFDELGRVLDRSFNGTDFAPAQVVGLTEVIAIAAGEGHTVAVKSDGTVWTFGKNESGQLGRVTDPKLTDPVPVQVAGLSGIRAVAAGSSHTLALAADGTVFRLVFRSAASWDAKHRSSRITCRRPYQVSPGLPQSRQATITRLS